jgi:hypothetical protein
MYSLRFPSKCGITTTFIREETSLQFYKQIQGHVTGKGIPNTPEGPERGRGIGLHFLDLGARRSGWSAPRLGRFTPGKDSVPIVKEAGWAAGPVWTCAKNLAPTTIRSLDRPARSQSL